MTLVLHDIRLLGSRTLRATNTSHPMVIGMQQMQTHSPDCARAKIGKLGKMLGPVPSHRQGVAQKKCEIKGIHEMWILGGPLSRRESARPRLNEAAQFERQIEAIRLPARLEESSDQAATF